MDLDLLLKSMFSFLNFNKKQKKLGLSFRGGGARCGVYLGILKALEEEGIKIDYIIGSSWGAAVGGIYAAGVPIDKIHKAFKEFGPDDFINILYSIKTLSLVSRDKSFAYMHNLIGDTKIEDCKIKTYIQVTNLETKECEVIEKGPLIEAIFASSALPILFNPVEVGGRIYMDGDFSAGFGAEFLRSRGAKAVIGISTMYDKGFASHFELSSRILEPFDVLINKIRSLDQKIDPVDLLLNSFKTDLKIIDFKNGADLMELGYIETKRRMGEIKRVVY